MPPRIVLIIGGLLIVVLMATIPVAFLMGNRHAASHPRVEHPAPAPSAPPSAKAAPARAPAPSQTPAQEPPAREPPSRETPSRETAATAEPAKAPSEPESGASSDAAHGHAKGGLLGGLVASVSDDAAAEGKRIADDLDAQGKAVAAKARTDATAALTKTADHAASSVDSAADLLEKKAQQAIDGGARAAHLDPHDASQAGAEDPSLRSFVDGLAKQEATDAAALASLSATVHGDLAAAAKEVSAKVHAYGDSIKKMANPVNLLHSFGAADESSLARDIDKQAAQVKAALEAFATATDAIQHRCDDAIAQLRQGTIDERAKLTAEANQASAACDRQIASLRAHLTTDIAQAVAAATSPLDDGQARPKTTKPGR